MASDLADLERRLAAADAIKEHPTRRAQYRALVVDALAAVRAAEERADAYREGGQQVGYELAALRARCEQYEAALRFYADEDTYRNRSVFMCGHGSASPADGDRGRRAREALADAAAGGEGEAKR